MALWYLPSRHGHLKRYPTAPRQRRVRRHRRRMAGRHGPATTDLPKTWEKVEKLESLLAFDVGTVVAMEGKGVGRIAEANLGLESFKVDFERIKGMTVGFKAAAKLLQPLEPSHVLRRKLE